MLENLEASIKELALAQQRAFDHLKKLSLDVEFIKRRMSSYLGAGRAITYLDDETPIYVNSNDYGPPANFISGGVYEQANLDVLLSFLMDDSVFLDVGANLGFFSLKLGARLRQFGRVEAFEPHPELVSLLRASAFLNGLGGMEGGGQPLRVHRLALGEENGIVNFAYPPDHLGGGTQVGDEARPGAISAEIRRLDDLFPNFAFDIAKIDVEGHELGVLRGMRETIGRSSDPKILFEKFGRGVGPEPALEEEIASLGLTLHKVGDDARLLRIEPGDLAAEEGYFLACRPGALAKGMDRNFFTVWPRQLLTRPATQLSVNRDELVVEGHQGELLFHGPYWFLRRGVYQIALEGEIEGRLRLVLSHRYGYAVQSLELSETRLHVEAVVDFDLMQFECIGYADSSRLRAVVRSLTFKRIA